MNKHMCYKTMQWSGISISQHSCVPGKNSKGAVSDLHILAYLQNFE